MILADTSVWINHLRRADNKFSDLLNNGRIFAHPMIIGELAMGNLTARDLTLAQFLELPQIVVALDDEVLRFVNEKRLFGLGIGFVDAHLLASVQMTSGASLWTHDKRLFLAAASLGLNF